MEELEPTPCKKNPFEKVDIEIKPSPIHRYGVFAKKDIAPKKVIEECPVILFNKLKTEHLDAITDRAFSWDDNSRCLALGYGCMYNHSQQPNTDYILDRQNQIIRFIASSHIPAGGEILINYGDSYWAAHSKKSLAIKLRNDSSSSRIIVFLLLLLGLSKVFPHGLHNLPADTKTSHQPAQVLTNPF